MTEYIIDIPHECFSICDGVIHDRYYPDERHDPMPIQEVVRCRDCKWGIDGGKYCAEGASDSWDWRNVEPDGFCAWGERRGA